MNDVDKNVLFEHMDATVNMLNTIDVIHIKNKDEVFYDFVNQYFGCITKIGVKPLALAMGI